MSEYRYNGTATTSANSASALQNAIGGRLAQSDLGVSYISVVSAGGNFAIGYTYVFNIGVLSDDNPQSVVHSVLNDFFDELNSFDGGLFSASTPTTTTGNVSNTVWYAGLDYVVKSGDTLSKIGNQLGIKWQDLATINGIKSPYLISVGQHLKTAGTTPIVNATQAQQVIKQNQQITGQNTPVINPNLDKNKNPNDSSLAETLGTYFGLAPTVLLFFGIVLVVVVAKPKK